MRFSSFCVSTCYLITYTDVIPPFTVVTGLHVRVFALCVLIFPLLFHSQDVSLLLSVITLPSMKEMLTNIDNAGSKQESQLIWSADEVILKQHGTVILKKSPINIISSKCRSENGKCNSSGTS